MASTRQVAFRLAAGGGVVLAALTQVDWFRRTATERATGDPTGPSLGLTLFDTEHRIGVVLLAVSVAVAVLAVLRVAPWLVGAAGLVLAALLAWTALTTIGHRSLACCSEVVTDTDPSLALMAAAVAAATVAVSGIWAAESD